MRISDWSSDVCSSDLYVSPKHVANRTWAPTWNYSVARFDCRIAFDIDANDKALRRLTDKMEAMCGDGWTVDEVGSPRYETMKTHIIAFRADILGCDATFKLGDRKSTRLNSSH